MNEMREVILYELRMLYIAGVIMLIIHRDSVQ